MKHEHKLQVPEEVKAKIERAKTHLKENRTTYLVGAGCLVAGYFLRRPKIVPTPVITNTTAPYIAPVMKNIVNTIVLPAHGDPGDVVQNLRTLETYASKGELARALGIPRVMVTRYFRGDLPDLLGQQFKIVGKAGHPIQVA